MVLHANLPNPLFYSQDVPILLGDLEDPQSLRAAFSQAKVVISTAGPYLRLGTPVVDAAVHAGTHYVDITGRRWDDADVFWFLAAGYTKLCGWGLELCTPCLSCEHRVVGTPRLSQVSHPLCIQILAGEIPWVTTLVEKYHESAREKGIRLIPCCA